MDPYTSSGRICDALKAHNIEIIAVLTARVQVSSETKKNRLPMDKFTHVYSLANDDCANLFKQIKHYNILSVVSGCELSTDLADQLSALLCPGTTNNPMTSQMRMNKYHMQEALKVSNLHAVKQLLVSNRLIELEKSVKLQNFSFPVIVKPAASNGTYGVNCCYNFFDIKSSLNKILGTTHPRYGAQVNEAVIQECLTGEEYFVDTVSYQGKHKVVSIQRYFKVFYKNVPVYRYCEIIPNAAPPARISSLFVKQALTAVGLKFGFAHTEIFVTGEGKPFLVEVNPRVSGAYGNLNKIAKFAYGIDQADAFVESIMRPEVFLKNVDHVIDEPKYYSRNIFVQCWQEKIMKEFNREILNSLPSFEEVIVLKKAEVPLSTAKELGDTVAMILLKHKNKQQVISDSEKIYEWEKSGALF